MAKYIMEGYSLFVYLYCTCICIVRIVILHLCFIAMPLKMTKCIWRSRCESLLIALCLPSSICLRRCHHASVTLQIITHSFLYLFETMPPRCVVHASVTLQIKIHSFLYFFETMPFNKYKCKGAFLRRPFLSLKFRYK